MAVQQKSSISFVWRIAFGLASMAGIVYLFAWLWTSTGGTFPVSLDEALAFVQTAIDKTGGQIK